MRFQDPWTFTRAFKATTGQTPAEYRRERAVLTASPSPQGQAPPHSGRCARNASHAARTAAHDLFADTELKRDLLRLGGGHARIYGPDGRSLATPLAPTEEGILYADINYAEILGAKNAYDPVGHYSRPDVLQLMFNPTANPMVVRPARDPELSLPLTADQFDDAL